MKLTTVDNSTNVAAHGYDEATRTMAVRFKSGGLYHVADVPKEIYERFCRCDSFGRFYQSEIRGKFKAERQPEKKEG
jgi:hypothetical protein